MSARRAPAQSLSILLSALGAVGSALVALASYRVGALPTTYVAHPPLALGRTAAGAVFLVGLVLLASAWLGVGALLRHARSSAGARLVLVRRCTLAWALPLLVALPVQSRDLWAYLAQGRVSLSGLDPYRVGPAALPGVVSDQVSARWAGAPSPYGPLWVVLTERSAALTGTHLVFGVLALRVFALAGLVLLAWAVPALAVRLGGRADVAGWLAVANPLTLVTVFGGGHNDLLMIGVLAVGLLVAARYRNAAGLAAAAALVTAAALVKAPAAVALPFLVPLWHRPLRQQLRAGGGRLRVGAYAVVVGVAAATTALVTALSGLGLGWLSTLGRSPGDPYGWVSFVNPVIFTVRAVTGGGTGPLEVSSTLVRAVDAVAEIATLLVVARAWWRAQQGRPQVGPAALAGAFTAVLVLAPTIRPWYGVWPLALAAAALRPGRWVVVAAGACLIIVFGVGPEGNSRLASPVTAVTLIVVVLGAWFVLRSPGWAGAQRTSNATG